MPEASDHEAGAEMAQLFLVRLARRHECRRLDPEQVLLPRGRTCAEREHVMDPRTMTVDPMTLARKSRTHGHITRALAERAVAQQQRSDRQRTEPQRHTQ